MVLSLKTVICSLSVTLRKSKSNKHNFEGILADIFESFFPKKNFNVTLFETNNCLLGRQLPNGSFTGIYQEIINKNLDLGLFFAKDQLLNNHFFYSPVLCFEEILYFYFFEVKFNKMSILTNLRNINFSLIFLTLMVILSRLLFRFIIKNVYQKLYKLLLTIFISFFLTNYILGSLNVLMIEFDKTNFLSTSKDLSLTSYYKIIFKSDDLREYFKLSYDVNNRNILTKSEKSNLINKPKICTHMKSFDDILNCVQGMKEKKLVYILEDRYLAFFEPIYCSDAHQSLNKNKNLIWINSQKFATIANFLPYNRNIDIYKRKKIDNHLNKTFTFGYYIKSISHLFNILKKQLLSSNPNCIQTERSKFLSNFFFAQLTLDNYKSLIIYYILFQFVFLICFSKNFFSRKLKKTFRHNSFK